MEKKKDSKLVFVMVTLTVHLSELPLGLRMLGQDHSEKDHNEGHRARH